MNPESSTSGSVTALPFAAARPNAIPKGEVDIHAITQEREGPLYKLRGQVKLETAEMALYGDEVDYNEETGDAEARGNVRFEHFEGGEQIEADRVEYNVTRETGKYYNIRGSAPAKIEARPGVLTTTSPFSFQGKWAERIKNRYILYDGIITNCKLPKPWWTLRGPVFDVIPGDRAIARKSTFYLRKVPLFYTPYFYKSLERMPRKSGLLTPSIGNSSRRGLMVGGGYFWAINRSYDTTYRAQYFSQRGLAHHVDFRGKPGQKSDFNFVLYGVQDRGRLQDDGSRVKEGGYLLTLNGNAEWPKGFEARAAFNYLDSFTFRQAFTESFYEAIFSQVSSVGFVAKHWSSFSLNAVVERQENFQNVVEEFIEAAEDVEGAEPTRTLRRIENRIVIRKLPSVEFSSRDRLVNRRVLPLWVSFNSSAGALGRSQQEFRTRNFVDRMDVEPRIMTALRWKDIHLTPAFSVRETHYGSSRDSQGKVIGNDIWRSSREFSLGLALPSLARVFASPKWLGDQVKHVIEPRAQFRYVSGINNFNRLLRFDESDLLSNTNEVELMIVNRLYSKRKDIVQEVLSLEVSQRRFFDPTFGGAVAPGQRNVLTSTVALTGYTFLDQPRYYSPIVSVLRMSPVPGLGLEWRADYDPLRGKVVNSTFSADTRFNQFFFSAGHTQVGSVPTLSPSSNQLRFLIGAGQDNKRGWSTAASIDYDYLVSIMRYATTQITYNTDCCGFSVQYRRFSFGLRNENQFRVAFGVANIGSFGTLRRQERIF